MILISVRDSKAETWSPPVCVQNKAVAMRDFSRACTQSNTLMSQCPADFDLWHVGDWIKDKVEAIQPEHLANGQDFARSADNG